jgi:hypothetical protein
MNKLLRGLTPDAQAVTRLDGLEQSLQDELMQGSAEIRKIFRLYKSFFLFQSGN